MSRTLTRLFRRLGAGAKVPAAGRKVAGARPQVESLGERLLPTTVLSSSLLSIDPRDLRLAYQGPSLKGKSVEITGVVNGSPRDFGTVRFTSMDAYGYFQGTFECHVSGGWFPFGHHAEYYEASLDIGTIPISGHVSPIGRYVLLGGGFSYSISFSGAGDGMVTEHHHYLLDDPMQPDNHPDENEYWMVADHQTISFSGSLYASGSALTLNGTAAMQNTGAWLMGDTHTMPNDPNHRVQAAPDWLIQLLAEPYTAWVSDPIV